MFTLQNLFSHSFEGGKETRRAGTHLRSEAGYFGVSQRLRDSRQHDGEARKQVHLKPPQLLPGQPGEDRQRGL